MVATVLTKCFKVGSLEQLSLHGRVFRICENAIFYFDVILVLSCVHNW